MVILGFWRDCAHDYRHPAAAITPRLVSDKPAPRLYDRIVEVLRVRHYSRRTEEACIHWIRRYIEFHQHRHPRQLAEGDANRFLTHLR
jgi:Phage integrase, N-terminal SAM-like domain